MGLWTGDTALGIGLFYDLDVEPFPERDDNASMRKALFIPHIRNLSDYHMNRCSRPSSSKVPSSALH